MDQYVVTGMSCAACSSRVEKAVSKVDGVTSCSVSLLTNSFLTAKAAKVPWPHDFLPKILEQANSTSCVPWKNT